MAPSPQEPHQRASGNLFVKLVEHVKRARLGRAYEAPFDVILSPHDTVQPDVLFISTARLAIVTTKNVRGAPDWVAEIVSDESRERDYQAKKHLYAHSGVREYWIIDPPIPAVEVYVLEGRRYRMVERITESGKARSRIIRGLSVTLKSLLE
jgi:Uma2 family endonuclease